MNQNRQRLFGYLDQRIDITGMFERFATVVVGFRFCRTALLQDVYARVDGRDTDIGHVWLQNADPLNTLGLTFGDRIRCNVRLTEYKKRLQVPNAAGAMVERKVSFAWPTEVEVISRLHRGRDDEDFQGNRPSLLVGEVRALANRVGWDELASLVETLRTES
jgi:hypothetical protein